MNTKLKFTLIGLIAICIVSIAFNVVLCSRKASTSAESPTTERVRSVTDSLKIAELRDSTNMLLYQIKSISISNSENSTEMSQLKDKVAKAEKDLTELQKKLNTSEALKQEYYSEIQRLIHEIEFAKGDIDGKVRPAKKIKVDNKYKEEKR